MNQNKQERRRLTAEFSNAQPNVEGASKACNDTVKELAEKAEEIKALEKMLCVVIRLSQDLRITGHQKYEKLQQLEKVLEGSRNLPQASQELTEPKKTGGNKRALIRNSSLSTHRM